MHPTFNTFHKNLEERKDGNVLFNDVFNTFYLCLYGIGYVIKDHLKSERGNLLQSTWATLFD